MKRGVVGDAMVRRRLRFEGDCEGNVGLSFVALGEGGKWPSSYLIQGGGALWVR